MLTLGPAVYSAYMFTQYILGPDYLQLPGNSELFFPLHLSLFVLGGALAIGAWQAIDPERLPSSRRFDRLGGILLLALGGFLAVRWLPALFALFALVLAAIAATLYRPLFRPAAGAAPPARTDVRERGRDTAGPHRGKAAA